MHHGATKVSGILLQKMRTLFISLAYLFNLQHRCENAKTETPLNEFLKATITFLNLERAALTETHALRMTKFISH